MSTTEAENTPAASPPRTLDEYLERTLPKLTKRERRRLVARGGVMINGAPAPDLLAPVGPEDRIEVPPPPEASAAPAPPPEEIPEPRQPRLSRREERPAPPAARPQKFITRGLRLVYEDADLLVVDKGPGILTADPLRKTEDTVFDILKRYARSPQRSGKRVRGMPQRLWIIHRLDKEASGLLVFAKSAQAFETLKEDFRAKRVHRVYAAVVEGIVGPPGFASTHQSFLIEEPGPGDRPGTVRSIKTTDYRGAPDQSAKLAVTHYRVVGSQATPGPRGGLSLLQVRLETGRKNQIRVHMADLGHPLAGDFRFGASNDELGRLALHAESLGFNHPRTGISVRFSSPPPAAFYRVVGMKPARVDAEDQPPPPAPPSRHAPPSDPRDMDTSWDRVASWYDEMLSDKGNDHYEDVILPGALRLIEPKAGTTLLDVACGQGILCRRLATLGMQVTGVDASPQLISTARKRGLGLQGHASSLTTPEYHVGDARELASLATQGGKMFDAAACIMALGNIEPIEPVMRGVAGLLRHGGTFVFVIAHPSFRAPGQTSWEWDGQRSRQFRRIDGYLSNGQTPIQMHPGKDASIVTWTFHRPLQTYSRLLADAGFVIDRIEEWPGKRLSTSGPRAAEENRARREIPLFMAVRAIKQQAGTAR